MLRLRAASLAAVACAGLVGCGSVPLPPPSPDLIAAPLFAQVDIDTDPAQAIAPSPAMRSFLDREMQPLIRVHGPSRAMALALSRLPAMRLEYDASFTRTAAEAFDARAGNCLSLTLMTGALAKAMGVTVTYQQVDGGSAWSRSGRLLAYSGHVNVVIGDALLFGTGARWAQRLVVDFLPAEDVAGHRTTPISEATVLGMFLNNRAAEALAAGRIDEAHAWVRSALGTAPGFVPAWNTLALLLEHRGRADLAQRVLAHAAATEPGNTRVLANLAAVLTATGRDDEAAAWRERLRALEPQVPFAWFDRGREAAAAGNWQAAYAAFQRELDRDPDQHEVHAWAARAAEQLGQTATARRHLERARETGPSPTIQALYAAKLDRLNAPLRH
ncbi:MAG: tetratricopeptide repeat protein [Burkholderiaceae bacterium]|nr:tetratricopeptide repeat protein [Burkholderiaceae bacterium]